MSVVTALLVRWQGGFMERTDTGSVTSWGRKEGFLQLGNIANEGEVDRVCTAVFGFQSEPRVATVLSIEPQATDPDGVDHHDEPYVDFGVGDTITAPDVDGTASVQRVVALTVAEDNDGEVTFANELKNQLTVQDERFADQLKRMSNGTLQGSSLSASPNPGPVYTKAENGDSVGALRGFVNEQLLRRAPNADPAPRVGIFGGTFDPSDTQKLETDFTITLTAGATGHTFIPFPAAFPTGLLSAVPVLGEPGVGGVPYLLTVLNSSSDNTGFTVLAVDVNGIGYPTGYDLVLNVRAAGW